MPSRDSKLYEDVGYLRGKVDSLCELIDTIIEDGVASRAKFEGKIEHVDVYLDSLRNDMTTLKTKMVVISAGVGCVAPLAVSTLWGLIFK